jgi:hypothetical protein
MGGTGVSPIFFRFLADTASKPEFIHRYGNFGGLFGVICYDWWVCLIRVDTTCNSPDK